MGRSPCCAKEGLNRGAWTAIEDKILTDYIKIHGEGKWRNLPKRAGLKRCGKSCRLRWLNYLRPDIKRGNITRDEEDLIIRLHKLLGNRWSLIAGRLPGRTDNEIKNYWNTNIGKKLQNNGNSKTKPSPTSSGSPSRARQDKDIIDSEPDPQKGPGSCLVRTKATRCTKVIVIREVQPLQGVPYLTIPHDDEDMKVRCDHHDDEKKMEAPLPSFLDSEANNEDDDDDDDDDDNNNNMALDFMGDFEMDEGFFSDLLNMDISEPTCFDQNKEVQEDKSNTSTISEQGCHQHLSSSPAVCNDTHNLNNNNNVSEDSFHDSENFQSMSALMENEFDWL